MPILERVILVDDDFTTNFINKRLFSKLEISKNIVIKTNGQEAYNYIVEHCKEDEEYPTLIILDLNMPQMNGFEFIESFKTFLKGKEEKLKVAVLTSSEAKIDIARVNRSSNYLYVVKPLSMEKIMEILHVNINSIRPY